MINNRATRGNKDFQRHRMKSNQHLCWLWFFDPLKPTRHKDLQLLISYILRFFQPSTLNDQLSFHYLKRSLLSQHEILYQKVFLMNFFPWYPECITEVCHFHSIYYLWVICQTMEEKNLQRIVKMQLKPESTETFLSHFDTIKGKIATFPGCLGLRLLQDTQNKNILFTYSLWESPNALEQYRHSELFQSTWTFVKTMFEERAEAWSTYIIREV